MARRIGLAVGVFLAGLSTPLQAECTGGGCYDGLVSLFLAVLIYGTGAIVILVLLARRSWRRLGWKVLGVAALVALVPPMVSQIWGHVRVWRVEAREIVGQPPRMTGREPLFLASEWDCQNDACAALLEQRPERGVYVLRTAALERLDLSQPLALKDLPLELWTGPPGMGIRQRGLTPAERAEAAGRIDYLVAMSSPYYRSATGMLEQAFRLHPVFEDLGEEVLVELALAPLDPAQGVLDLPRLQFDLLDLYAAVDALGVPWAPGFRTPVWNDRAGQEAVLRAFCPATDGVHDWSCRSYVGL